MTLDIAKSLFSDCFPTDPREADIILDFANRFGSILLKEQDRQIANMICSCDITDGDFSASYLFACCTKQEFRSLGIFKEQLSTFSDKPIFLIPESDSLHAFYERLGFSPIKHLTVTTDGFDDFSDVNPDRDELFAAYIESIAYPKKDFNLFSATLDAFYHYGGRVLVKNGVFITVIGDEIREVFADSFDKIIAILKKSSVGNKKLLLPYHLKDRLIQNGIEFSENTLAMARNLPSQMNKIYINNLFN